MILDIDNFKKRNDQLGHASGDRALEFLGSVLQHCARLEDLCVRLGGEEFAILMPDTDAKTSLALASRIHQTLKENPDAPANLTVSIGIASTDESTSTWSTCLHSPTKPCTPPTQWQKSLSHSSFHGPSFPFRGPATETGVML